MSRDPVSKTPAARSSGEPEPNVVPLDSAAARAVEALVDCFEKLYAAALDLAPFATPHVAARSDRSGAWRFISEFSYRIVARAQRT